MKTNIEARSYGILRTLLGLFVLLTCLKVWLTPLPGLPAAQAQIPDAGGQRMQLVESARETNRLLTQLVETVKKGTLNVRLVEADGVRPDAARVQPSAP